MIIAINNAIGMVIPNLYFRSGEFTIETKYNIKYQNKNHIILFNIKGPTELSDPLK